MSLSKELTALFPEMCAMRQHVHQHPEVMWKELETRNTIKEKLQHIGKVREVAQTGLIIDIVGTGKATGKPRMIALRADLDALPMTEGNTGLSYRSANEGVAHMCGHDGHLTSLSYAALLFHAAKDRIPSDATIRLLFQPAEEGGFGAVKMIEDGCLEGVDECYGYHNWPGPLGSLAVKPGAMMAHACHLYITVNGKGGHASKPEACIDPVLVASTIVVQLQTIMSRSVPCGEAAVLSICKIHGGENYNVIPESVKLEGTIRDFNPKVYDLIKKRIEEIVHSTCKSFGENCSAEVTFQDGYPVVMNCPTETEYVKEVGRKWLGEDKVHEKDLPVHGAEDFAYYIQKVPGCFFFLGMGEKDHSGKYNLVPHSSHFNFNDNLLPVAASLWVRLIEHRLGTTIFDEAQCAHPRL
eukprot:TRINITY_DN58961_c0_g1_i1.p1 TRINITY_DN58961_c0_g1~~TRINITY_DN58961_c0_g1_i1.p1  ORF type:complete len:411 (-),score=24.22 TRINITY_DN58961_c0_g1_i1:135-1367(-)